MRPLPRRDAQGENVFPARGHPHVKEDQGAAQKSKASQRSEGKKQQRSDNERGHVCNATVVWSETD